MENHVLLNNNATSLGVESGKLQLVLNAADQNQWGRNYIPMFIPGIYSISKTVGNAGTSRVMRWTPTAANNTEYKVTVLVYKEQDWGFFGPNLSSLTVSYTSDATATAAEITAGITSAINAIGAYWGITATDGSTYVDVTSNTTVPQNINVLNSGAGSATVAQQTAFVKPYGLASYLQSLGLTTATTGAVYTSYEFTFGQPSDSGRAGMVSSNVNQTIWVNAASTTLTGLLDAFIAAPFTSPAAFTLERE